MFLESGNGESQKRLSYHPHIHEKMEFTFGESDLAELNRFLKTSQRPNVQKFLQNEISRLSALDSQQKTNIQGLNLSAQLSRGESKSANNAASGVVKKTKAAPPKKPTKPPAAIPGAKYIVPSSFGWDQKGDWITIYIRDLPGVGAFKKAMNVLKEKKLDTAIIKAANEGKRIIGICLGMQLLFSSSQEFGYSKGLNLISGSVFIATTLKP